MNVIHRHLHGLGGHQLHDVQQVGIRMRLQRLQRRVQRGRRAHVQAQALRRMQVIRCDLHLQLVLNKKKGVLVMDGVAQQEPRQNMPFHV